MTADQIPTLPALPIAAHLSETTHTTPTMSKTTDSDGNADVAAPLTIDTLRPSHSAGNSRPAGSNESDCPINQFDSQIKTAETSRAPATPASEAEPIRPVFTETASQLTLKAFAGSGDIAGKLMDLIRGAMNATRTKWDKDTEAFVELPDHKTRLAAVELYLAHTIGLPVQRTENLNLNGKMPGAGDKRKPATPALLAHYARELDKAKRQAEQQRAGAASMPAREETSG